MQTGTSDVARRLLSRVMKANREFALVEPNDRVMVCLSGGKDSYAMMVLLERLRRRVPFSFSLVAVNLDQGQPGFEQHVIRDWCDASGFEHQMIAQDTYSVVKEKVPEGRTTCSLCSRLRRGALYAAAGRIGATKVALGHHRDDAIETLMLNVLYAGQIKAMPPRLVSDDGRNVLIRPLIACPEDWISAFSVAQAFPILPCDLCGSQENLQREQVKRLLAQLNDANPNVKGNVFAALRNVVPSHLMDATLARLPADAALQLRPGEAVSFE